MDLQKLRYFVVLAEELHFTRAAQRLYLDQGALSRAIRKLEADLGLVLFDRTSRRVELSEAGEALLPAARALLERVERVMAVVREHRDPHGPTRIALLDAADVGWVTPV